MKKKLKKTFEPKKSQYKSDSINDINIPINEEKEEHQYTNRESIINDLKLKGFNELQIDDIFETFRRNSVSNRYPINEENDFNPILENHTIDTNIYSTNRKGKKIQRLNSNSKYKNSIVIKTENIKKQDFYQNKPIKYNCAKLYVNASSDKYRKKYFYLKEKKENKYKNNIKIENNKRKKINPIIISSTNNSNTNRIYSRKINQKVENYHNKFKLSYRNSINDIEDRKDENLKKYEFDDNYHNYNFKIIFETKKARNRINNIGYLDIKSIKSNKGRENYFKSRNDKKEENKNNISNSVNISNNSLLYNKNIKVKESDTIEYNLKEIKEEKENNQLNEIKINKRNSDDSNNSNNNFDLDKKDNNENFKKKLCNQIMKELNSINDINKDEENIDDNGNNNMINKNILGKKYFYNSNTHFVRKEKNKPNNSNFKNNILVIRQQNSEIEEEKISNENNFISIIKQENGIDKKENIESNSNKNNNYKKNIEKNFKSRSLSKISNSNKYATNINHSFVNINLCKRKFKKNSSIFYENGGLSTIEHNDNNNQNALKKSISSEEISISNKNKTDKIKEKNDETKSINSFKINEEINSIKEENKENDIINKKNPVTNIIRINKIPNPKQSEKNTHNIKLSNNMIQRSITYNLTTKKYPNGTYKGIICNGKREKNGIMFFDNGAKYEGQWKNDKKHGKGVFTSSHYFDCKNFVGMKYEGDFKDDKFEGYGVTTYTNGDKYEGEWKNNKQYGKGVVTYFNGEKYDGEWIDGFFDGIGIFYLKNGERYEGRFKDNKYNGYGKYFYLNGEWLEGIFKNDHPSGNCLLHKKDGNIVNVVH